MIGRSYGQGRIELSDFFLDLNQEYDVTADSQRGPHHWTLGSI